MAQQIINVGSAANSGGGDPLRDAMIKVNENFTELYDLVEGDAAPTIRGADSTLLVDGTNSTINAEALTGVAPSGVVTWPNISNTPDSLAEYGIVDAYTKAQTDQKITLATLGLTDGVTDFKGSVFGDDSTLLVDGVNGIIPKANIEDSTNWDTAFGWGDHSAVGYALQATTYTKAEVDSAIAATGTGDVVGSVFADDSTLLVDAVNGTISWSVISNTPTTISGYGITDAFNGAYTYLDLNTDQDAVVNTKYLVEDTVGGSNFRLPASASVGDQIVIFVHPDSISNLSVQYYNSGVPTNFNSIFKGNKTEYIYTGTGVTGGWINI